MEVKNCKVIKREKHKNILAIPERQDWVCMVMNDNFVVRDKVLGEVPNKGVVVGKISNYWKLMIEREIMATDLVLTNYRKCTELLGIKNSRHFDGRMSLIKKTEVLPIVFVVRGYMTGSLWKSYSSKKCKEFNYYGNYLPEGLSEGERLPQVIVSFERNSARKKSDVIDIVTASAVLGDWLKERSIRIDSSQLIKTVQSNAIAIYNMAYAELCSKEIVLADTRFEFGFFWMENNQKWDLCLIGEVLTPDSSRMWFCRDYQTRTCFSFAKDITTQGSISERAKISLHDAYKAIGEVIIQ